MSLLDEFIREARALVGDSHIQTEPDRLASLAENSLALPRHFAAAVYPSTTEQVASLVRLAAKAGLKLHPVSRGRNLGYGDRAPVADGAVLLELSRMRQVREYDAELGQVVIEAGVSQADLHAFLTARGAPYWMDATGAGLDASILGNALEGGFGHTPLGNHRESFSDAEVVLADGRIVRTGRFPGLGPDLKGMFVQSNFGVVTAMRLPLFPVPERFESFVLRTDDRRGLAGMVDALRRLRMAGVIESCVHLANPMRYLISSRPCPPELRDRVATDDDAIRIMSSRLLPLGRWNAAGGLYGSRQVVAARRREMSRAMRGLAKVAFFGDEKLARLSAIAARLPGKGLGARLRESLDAFGHIHRLMQGVPTDQAYVHIGWRVADPARLGLIWFAPSLDAKGCQALRLVETAAPLFTRHGFEMPLTVTLVTPDRMVAVFNIVFDKLDPGQTARAKELYADLGEAFGALGMAPYRTSIMDTHSPRRIDPGRAWVLDRIKTALDPDTLLAPGRYGIPSGWTGPEEHGRETGHGHQKD